MRWKRLAILAITGLSVSVAGCGSLDASLPDSTTTTDPRVQELDATTSTVTTVEILIEGRLADLVAAWDVQGLDSYKFEAAVGRVGDWENAEVTTGAIGLNPPGMDITSGYRYIVTPEGARRTYRGEWKVLTDAETVPNQSRQAATWLLDKLPDGGQPDTRNGRPVTVYQIEDLEKYATDVGSWSAGHVVAEVWVDDQLGVSVETRLEQELVKEGGETDSLVITWRMYDLDVPLSIELPVATYPPPASPAALEAQNSLDRAFDAAAEFLAVTNQLPTLPGDLHLEGLVAIEDPDGVAAGEVGFLVGDSQVMLVAPADPGVWLCLALTPVGQRIFGNAPSLESFLDPAIGCDNLDLHPDWHIG